MANRAMPEGGPAVFSECRRFRYKLVRYLTVADMFVEERPQKIITFIMLNPSTANEQINDPTIRRCIGYAIDWGASQLIVGNIFAIRGTNPAIIRQSEEPIGDKNNEYLIMMAADAIESGGLVVAAWGNHGIYMDRGLEVANLLATFGIPLFCLSKTNLNMPSHPLYLPAKARPVLYHGSQEWNGGRANESLANHA